MKYTLLELTQNILSSMDSDEVTSINDTVESLQVANVIKTAYYDLITRAKLPEEYTLANLTDSGNGSTPVLMSIPADVNRIKWIQYDCQTVDDTDPVFNDMVALPLEDFLRRMHDLRPSEAEVDTFDYMIDTSTVTFFYRNDRAPAYYTSFDDGTLVFDSFDSEVDAYLLGSKSLAYVSKIVTFTLSDSYTPTLDEPQFQLLLNEAKSLAWAELKQTTHSKAEQEAKRGWSTLIKTKSAITLESDFDKFPSFGRK